MAKSACVQNFDLVLYLFVSHPSSFSSSSPPPFFVFDLLLFSREVNVKKMVRIQNECDRRMKEGADVGVLLCAVCPGDVQVH